MPRFEVIGPDNGDIRIMRWESIGLIPGSFNPLHAGHLNMAHYVEDKLGLIPMFELTTVNCDKGELDPVEVARRVSQFEQIGRRIVITKAPMFVQKSYLFSGCTFVVGTDTIERIGLDKYCFESTIEKEKMIERIAKNDCKFLVLDRNGHTLDTVNIPDSLRKLCRRPTDYVPVNISSTEIREGRKVPTSTADILKAARDKINADCKTG